MVQSVVAHIKSNDIPNPFGFLFEERNRQKLINPNIQWLVMLSMLLVWIHLRSLIWVREDFDKVVGVDYIERRILISTW